MGQFHNKLKILTSMVCPKVACIVLNWNGWRDTLRCLESLNNITYPNFDIVIVDNGSNDASVDKITDYAENRLALQRANTGSDQGGRLMVCTFGPQKENEVSVSTKKAKNSITSLILIRCPSNLGFAKGNNIGIKYSLGVLNAKYILLLNNDTVVDEHFLDELINIAETEDSIGICASKLLKMENHHIIDSTGHVFSWARIIDRGAGMVDKQQFDDQVDIIGAKGAAALYKGIMLNEIGLLDEEYVTQYEDAELSWRANVLGWQAKYVPTSVVYHEVGKTKTRDEASLNKHILLNSVNTIKTVQRHGSYFQKLLFAFPLIKSTSLIFGGKFLGKNNVSFYLYCKSVLFRYITMIWDPIRSLFLQRFQIA